MSIPMRWGSFLALPLPQPGRWYVKDMNALGFPILSVLLAVPLAAALWILFAPGSEAGRAQNARVIALGATLIDFALRSEEHTSELQSLMRISYAVFCLKKKK